MPRGATLLELLIALTVLALLLAIAGLPIVATRDRLMVAHQARRLAAAHADTRSAAMQHGARAELTVTPESLAQRRLVDGVFVAAWRRRGPAVDGVTLSGGATPIVFDSRGYSMGAGNRTWQLSRGGASVRVVVSRLGRLRVLR